MTDERYAAEELSEARRALADAERPVEVGGSSEGIVNRLYYASFHAAQAALYVQGVDPGSHGAVRNRFGEESFSMATRYAKRVGYLLRSPTSGDGRTTATIRSMLMLPFSLHEPRTSSSE